MERIGIFGLPWMLFQMPGISFTRIGFTSLPDGQISAIHIGTSNLRLESSPTYQIYWKKTR